MIFLLGLPVVAGMAVGYALGGRLRRLAAVRITALWLPLAAAALQMAQFAGYSPSGWSLTGPIFVLAGAWALINLMDRPPA